MKISAFEFLLTISKCEKNLSNLFSKKYVLKIHQKNLQNKNLCKKQFLENLKNFSKNLKFSRKWQKINKVSWKFLHFQYFTVSRMRVSSDKGWRKSDEEIYVIFLKKKYFFRKIFAYLFCWYFLKFGKSKYSKGTKGWIRKRVLPLPALQGTFSIFRNSIIYENFCKTVFLNKVSTFLKVLKENSDSGLNFWPKSYFFN